VVPVTAEVVVLPVKVFLAVVVTVAVMAIVVAATVAGCENMRDLHLFPFIPFLDTSFPGRRLEWPPPPMAGQRVPLSGDNAYRR
jgi:hypothetical protein